MGPYQIPPLQVSGPGSNGSEVVFHILQSSRMGASPSDVVEYHIQDTHEWE